MIETAVETSWHSYPSIFAIGHRGAAELFLDPVLIEEKIDGSQFSFGVFDGELKIRSKGQQMNVDAPEAMFDAAVQTVKDLAPLLIPGWTYRAEYLKKPKHNTLAYDRVPIKHLIIFDINTGYECYLSYADKAAEAARIGLEVVPMLYEGVVDSPGNLMSFLEIPSVLGGQKIEGFVVKNYARFGPDKKTLMGKFVSESFKEIHGGEWRKNNPTAGDIVERLILKYRTPARWQKAVQHLRERGELEQSPRDIGKIIKEVPADVLKECEADIVADLLSFALPHIKRGLTRGLPEWYKQLLLEAQFEEVAS